MNRLAILLIFSGFILFTPVGCGPDGPPQSPAVIFDQKHGGTTVTPYGEVVKGSAKDMGNGTVRYQTEGGEHWETVYGNGEFTAPVAIKP